jgi:hypothetical protein
MGVGGWDCSLSFLFEGVDILYFSRVKAGCVIGVCCSRGRGNGLNVCMPHGRAC